ncbi:hypothetical protein C4K28_2579 [Pseudomonas chlororaphis subsp. piscium]|nr:hypothetical protein C4K28_2579 [Pseudomonas chlororaphis subsp. piscium]
MFWPVTQQLTIALEFLVLTLRQRGSTALLDLVAMPCH